MTLAERSGGPPDGGCHSGRSLSGVGDVGARTGFVRLAPPCSLAPLGCPPCPCWCRSCLVFVVVVVPAEAKTGSSAFLCGGEFGFSSRPGPPAVW